MGEISLDSIMQKMLTTGFQATNVGLAINEINRMVSILVLNITCMSVNHTICLRINVSMIVYRSASSSHLFIFIILLTYTVYRLICVYAIDPAMSPLKATSIALYSYHILVI